MNHKKQDYNGGTQNWDIVQDGRGILHFANNEGLLSFDGTFWKLYPLPNKTIVRSIAISGNRIYVGGQDELGYFSPTQNGNLSFHSLKQLLPEAHRTFEDIWDIACLGGDLFFRSTTKIFHLRENKMQVYPARSSWFFSGTAGGKFLAQDVEEGLFRFENGTWYPVLSAGKWPTGFLVTSSLVLGRDSLLLTTAKHGLQLLTSGGLAPFALRGSNISNAQHFSSAIWVHQNKIAIGTYTNGCYVVDREGNVVQQFSRRSGLQNDNVRNLFCDKNQNLWLGLDNGIDFVALNNAVKHINPASLNSGTGYASAVLNGRLYLGLSDGLFQLPLPQTRDFSYDVKEFSRVNHADGQIWGLSVIGDELLVSAHDGLFQLHGEAYRPVVKDNGFWMAQPQTGVDGARLAVAGSYNGIQLLTNEEGRFSAQKSIPGFSESARFISVDNEQTVWTSHPYRGVYKIQNINSAKPLVTLYTQKNGLPSTLNNHVYRVKNQILIATAKGLYSYHAEKDVFEQAKEFKPFFGEMSVRYLREDAQGNIWFIQEKNLGVLSFSGSSPRLLYFPELKNKMVSGFEHINPIDENNVLVGAENGFYHINFAIYKKNDSKLNVFIRGVRAFGKTDSLLFGGAGLLPGAGEKNEPSLRSRTPFHTNSFHIQFSSPFFEQQSNIEYSYYLEGLDKSWSEWTKKTEKDYTNLPAGTYTFRVKARNNLGNESPADGFSFIVLPPWYQTVWAYLLYTALAAGFFAWLYKRHRKQLLRQQLQHREEQQHLLYLHQLEIEKSEKEIVKLKNEKLESEIEFKNSELASTAMHLVKKGELLTKIKDELQHLNKHQPGEADLANLKKIIRVISEEEKNNDDWEQFARHFNQVHDDFLILLKERFPSLTPHELKLCAYLRMNLSTKEIAQLVNISVRGVEISRYRLRKKLGIATEVNLFQFFLELTSQKAVFDSPGKLPAKGFSEVGP